MNDFVGSRHLVIGGDGGLGSAVVDALEDLGSTTTQLNRTDVDLRSSGELSAALTDLWTRFGPFDGLVHAAGLFPAHLALDANEALFDDVMAVNARSFLMATTTLARLAIDARRPLGVVAISSGAGRSARPGTVTYAASKAAVDAIVRGLALELNPDRIRVNAVAPGFVDVGSGTNPVPEEYRRELTAASPRGRLAVAADIVPAILWLLGPHSDWVTGQSLAIDGGASLGSLTAPSWVTPQGTAARAFPDGSDR